MLSLNRWSAAEGKGTKLSYIRLHLAFSQYKQEREEMKYRDAGERERH